MSVKNRMNFPMLAPEPVDPEEEMKRVQEFRRTGRAYIDIAPDDKKEFDFTTKPAPKQKEGKK
jgi:hypothetical protein